MRCGLDAYPVQDRPAPTIPIIPPIHLKSLHHHWIGKNIIRFRLLHRSLLTRALIRECDTSFVTSDYFHDPLKLNWHNKMRSDPEQFGVLGRLVFAASHSPERAQKMGFFESDGVRSNPHLTQPLDQHGFDLVGGPAVGLVIAAVRVVDIGPRRVEQEGAAPRPPELL